MELGSKRKDKVINVGKDQVLETMLNNYASEGWRVVSVTWNDDMSYYAVVLER